MWAMCWFFIQINKSGKRQLTCNLQHAAQPAKVYMTQFWYMVEETMRLHLLMIILSLWLQAGYEELLMF